jgi:hypothetical protein
MMTFMVYPLNSKIPEKLLSSVEEETWRSAPWGWCELPKHRCCSAFSSPVEPPRNRLWPLLPLLIQAERVPYLSCWTRGRVKALH